MTAPVLLRFLRAHQHDASPIGDLAREVLAAPSMADDARERKAGVPNTCPCAPADQRRHGCWRSTALNDAAARMFESGLRNGVVSLDAARRWLEEYDRICAEAFR